MSDQPNCLLASIEDVSHVNLDEPLAGGDAQKPPEIRQAFGRAALAAEDKSEDIKVRVFRSLAILFAFLPNYGEPTEPYRPFIPDGADRTPALADLSSRDLDVIEALFSKSTDVAVRARLGDILAIKKRKPQWWTSVVEAYLDAGLRCLEEDKWEAVAFIGRGLQLAARTGKKNPGFAKAQELALHLVRERWPTETGYFCYRLMVVLIEMRIGEPTEFAAICGTLADNALRAADPIKARKHYLLEAGWWNAAKDPQRSQQAHQKAAETYVTEADAWMNREHPSILGAAGALAHAVEALRQSRSPESRIDEIKKRLLEAQRQGMAEMQTTEFEINISAAVEAADKMMMHERLSEALKALAMEFPLSDPADLRKDVLAEGDKYIWQHLVGTAIVDDQGRVLQHDPALFAQKGEVFEKALESTMFTRARDIQWNLRVDAWIRPGQRRIWQDHQPVIHDLAPLLWHNPFVPPSHRLTFQRGLLAGLAGDYMMAAYFLTPQLENSFRWVLEDHGVDVSHLHSDLTQPLKLLGGLFDAPGFETIFGPEYRFELRGHLVEKSGYGFRNRVCHGFASDDDACSSAAVNIWWLTLRLCVDGMLGRGIL